MTVNRPIVEKLLTNVSNMYVPDNYLSERILPVIKVKENAGKIAGYGNDHIRADSFFHTGKGEYVSVDIDNRNNQSYFLEKHALKTIITEEDYRNVEDPYEAEVDAVNYITSLLWTEKEIGLASTLSNTSIITQNVTLSGTSQFNDETNSTPLANFATATGTIADAVGQQPNLAVMSHPVYRQLRKHPTILARLGFSQNKIGFVSDKELAMVLGVEELLIGTGLKNTAKQGQADSVVPVWGKDIIFMVAPKTPAKRQIALGYRLQVSTSEPRRVTKELLKDPVGATKILIDDTYQQLITNAKAAYLIKNAVA
jgi:hypothetical protein